MDRQRVACFSLLGLTLVLSACTATGVVNSRFDGPDAATVIEAEDGPFWTPVGLVSNRRSGLIYPVDLGRGWLLSDDQSSPFIHAAPIPLGAGRIAQSIAAVTTIETVTVWAVDSVSGSLLEVPWITGVENGEPIEVTPSIESSTFIDADGSGDLSTMNLLVAHTGAATTEVWDVEYDGSSWRVNGSASGLQQESAHSNLPYSTDGGELSFTISGSASAGDSFEIAVESGLVVHHEYNGMAQELFYHHASETIFATTFIAGLEGEASTGELLAFSASTGESIGSFDLPVGARPYRITGENSGVYVGVSDATLGGVYIIELDNDDVMASEVSNVAPGVVAAEIAISTGANFSNLFVAPAAGNEVLVYSVDSLEQVDVNKSTPDMDGISMESPVVGMAASTVEVELEERTSWGASYRDFTVAISTLGGELWLAEGSTGCFVQDVGGPYAYADTSSEFRDEGTPSNPIFYDGAGLGNPIAVSSCGGVVRDEAWAATFDEVIGAWLVEGAASGPQENLAWEDVRYISDNGTISFTILSGDLPSSHGDRFKWHTVSGLAVAGGDIDNDGFTDLSLEYPATPVAYTWLPPADEGDGWSVGTPLGGVLWPITNSDTVLLVDGGNAKTAVVID
jgi:hypothetical protein